VETPGTAAELAQALASAARQKKSIALNGAGSKRRMAGAPPAADLHISTAGLNRVLQYEPNDLTISVEAGLPWRELARILAENGQMVPLDPPFADTASVGGVIAANTCGPRRRLYGSARDVVIGMRFVTLEGRQVQSGGMVVKNVAGLDMAKLMIGSFGTLAAITVVNFKLIPAPEMERSFLLSFPSADDAIAARNRILSGVLQPSALDLLNPPAGSTLGSATWLLAIRVGGNPPAIDRAERELAAIGDGVAFEGPRHDTLWRHIQEFTPGFLERRPNGAVVRASCTLKEVGGVMAAFAGPAIARAGSGVCYGYFDEVANAARSVGEPARGANTIVEFAPDDRPAGMELWPAPGGDLELMRSVKNLFDPGNLLNHGRLYGRI
jgi:glycolate oxidase FAD binding subunit